MTTAHSKFSLNSRVTIRHRFERRRRARSDLNQGPVSNEFDAASPSGNGPRTMKWLFAMNQNADHRNIMPGDGGQLASLAGYTGSRNVQLGAVSD